MKKPNLVLSITILLLAILACGKSKTEEVTSGRLKFAKTVKYGSVGTHGSQGWYVSDQHLFVSDLRWSPDGIKVKDIADCNAGPNKAVEVLKCYSFADSKESVYILRMKANSPEWITASNPEYKGGKNLGEWVGDGHWLLFKDYYFNVETSEKRDIKGLPDFPQRFFRATSPDLETIVYEETGFDSRYDLPPDADVEKEREKQYKVFYDHLHNGIAAFWLIETRTGKVTILELKKDKYDWLSWKHENFPSQDSWLNYFQKQLVWEKDKNGKYQLVYPN